MVLSDSCLTKTCICLGQSRIKLQCLAEFFDSDIELSLIACLAECRRSGKIAVVRVQICYLAATKPPLRFWREHNLERVCDFSRDVLLHRDNVAPLAS